MKSARAVRMQASSSDLAKPEARIVWPARFSPVLSPVFAQNTIDIAASPEAVWRLLIDCVAWPRWYRHCSDVSILRGKPRLGPGSKFRFKTLGRYFEPEIVTFDPFTMLLWQARGPAGTRGAHACTSNARRTVAGLLRKKRKEVPFCFLCGPGHAAHS